MVLFALAGIAGHYFLGWEVAVPAGVILGLVVAPLVPAESKCGVKQSEKAETTSAPHA